MKLIQIEASSWKDGIQRAYELKGVFVSPPVDGWILIAGSLPEVNQPAFVPSLEELSLRFDRAFYFGTHRVVGYHAWAVADIEDAPNEEDVLEIASKWVLDPRELDQHEDASGPAWHEKH